MNTPLDNAKRYLQVGEPEKAFALLKHSDLSNPEHMQLMMLCRKTLSEQYVYLIKDYLDNKRLVEAQELILKYQKNLGTDSIIKPLYSKMQQMELSDNNLLARYSRISLKKITDITIALFILFTFVAFLHYIVDTTSILEGGFGSVAGIIFQTSCFFLYLSLLRNSIESIAKRKIISYILLAGFILILLQLFNKLLSEDLLYYGIKMPWIYETESTWNIELTWNYGTETTWDYATISDITRWYKVNFIDRCISHKEITVMGILNIISLILYIIAFSLMRTLSKLSFKHLYEIGTIFLAIPLFLLLLPYEDMTLAVVILNFISWLYFFFTLRKTVYDNL